MAVVLQLPRRDEEPQRPARLEPLAWLWGQLAEERDRYVLWLPGFMAFGIGLYFAIPIEPPLIAGAVIGVLLIAPAFLLPSKIRVLIIVPVAAMLIGFLAGEVRTRLVRSPVIARDTYADITGIVHWREPLDDGRLRIVLDVKNIARMAARDAPRRARITLRGIKDWPAIGDEVEIKAQLSPPAGPVAPGAYDFARIAWFHGIGAVGYGGNTLRVIRPAERADATMARWYARLRTIIQARIDKALPPARGGRCDRAHHRRARRHQRKRHQGDAERRHLACACRSPGSIWRWSLGLSSLSVRGGLALIEPIALALSGQEDRGLRGARRRGFYVGISDGSSPIIRSFIMFAVAILAMLIDRPALSLRTVAFAARSHSVVQPGEPARSQLRDVVCRGYRPHRRL